MIIDASADFNLPALLTEAGVPTDADALPVFRVYHGVSGEVGDGVAAFLDTGLITDVAPGNPPVVTSAAHRLITGQVLTIAGVVGVAVDGVRNVTVLSADTFSLDGLNVGGAYVSGGAWRATGLYKLPFDAALRNSLEPGKTYTVVLYYKVAGDNRTRQLEPFTVG